MKATELREICICARCSKAIGHTGLPLFWRVSIERFGVDLNAVRRQSGLEQFMGNVQLAAVMGPDEDLAKPMMEKKTITLCERCAIDAPTPIAMLAELEQPKEPA